MSENLPVCQEGIVEEILGDKTRVRIVVQSACGACHAKSLCSAAEMQEKIIEAETPDGTTILVGTRVKITMRKSLGNKAVLLSYAIPALLLITSLIIAGSLTGELAAAGISVLVLALYFTGIYLFRNRLARSFRFFIEPL